MALAQEAGGFWEQPPQLPQGRAQVHPTTAFFTPTAVGGSWLLQAAQQQDGPRCSRNRRTQEKDLHLPHPLLHAWPELSPCCILPALECWQHVLAARRGCLLMLFDSKVPLLFSATEVVPERCIFNVHEELSLDGLICKPSSCGIKRRKGSGKKENKVFLPVWCSAWQLVCVTRARASTWDTHRSRNSVRRSQSVIPSHEFCGVPPPAMSSQADAISFQLWELQRRRVLLRKSE